MAKYTTTDIPELVYDKICTKVKVENPAEANEEPKIEVKTVIAGGGNQGCDTDEFLGYTLCLRPVKGFQYANNKNYRINQEEAKTLIKQEVAISQLQ